MSSLGRSRAVAASRRRDVQKRVYTFRRAALAAACWVRNVCHVGREAQNGEAPARGALIRQNGRIRRRERETRKEREVGLEVEGDAGRGAPRAVKRQQCLSEQPAVDSPSRA
jgi:hypothetical protein